MLNSYRFVVRFFITLPDNFIVTAGGAISLENLPTREELGVNWLATAWANHVCGAIRARRLTPAPPKGTAPVDSELGRGGSMI